MGISYRRIALYAALVASVIVLLNIGGNQVGQSRVIEHGWPYCFAVCELDHSPSWGEFFLPWGDVTDWYAGALAWNAAIGMAIVVGATAFLATWRRKPGQRWRQFRLADGVRVLLILAVVFGAVAYRYRETQRQRRATARLMNEVSSLSTQWDSKCDWFWRPIGVDVSGWNADVVDVFFHAWHVRDEAYATLAELEHVRTLNAFVPGNSVAATAAVGEMRELRQLTISGALPDESPGACERYWGPLRNCDRLQDLKIIAGRDADLYCIAGFTSLRSLDLSNSEHITDEGLRHLAPLRRLRLLDLTNTGRTDDGIAKLIITLPELDVTDD